MKKLLLLVAFVLYIIVSVAQPVYYTTPAAIPATTGYLWPRICIAGNNPLITWGESFPFNLYYSRFVSGNFTTPVQLNPNGFGPYVQSWTGPEIDARGDTVYVVFTDENTFTAHLYVLHSYDAGVTFSDTVRADFLTTDIPRFPGVTVQPGGIPFINFLRFDQNLSGQSFVFTKSFDGGQTFIPDVNATIALSAEPCDCCPGYIVAEDNKVAVVFRNSVGNQRDFNVGISLDSGNTFQTGCAVDTNNWIVGVCPSSGPASMINGDTLTSVFMNAVTGHNRIYLSTVNLLTQQFGMHRLLFPITGTTNQNQPRMAGNGDTVAVVWDQSYSGGRMILFSQSVSGPAGLGVQVDTIGGTMQGFYSNPDIVFHNGTFHITYSDLANSQVMYLTASYNNIQSVEYLSEVENGLNAFISENGYQIQLNSDRDVQNEVQIRLIDMQGKVFYSNRLNSLGTTQTLTLPKKLTQGVYVLLIEMNGKQQKIKIRF